MVFWLVKLPRICRVLLPPKYSTLVIMISIVVIVTLESRVHILASGSTSPRVPGLNADCLMTSGHVNLALLTGFSDRAQDVDDDGHHQGPLCALHPEPWVSIFYQFIQGFVYAIERVNARDDLLPNITLGYVVMDTCWRDLAALGQALHLVPPTDNDDINQQPETEAQEIESGRLLSCSDPRTGQRVRRPQRVVGVVGPGSSAESMMVAGLFTVLQIPMLATLATNDDLSDKTRFEYFTRLVPPDKFQVQTMMRFIQHHNWTYISLLYSEGVYGEHAAKMLMKSTRAEGICIPVSEMVANDVDVYQADEIVHKLSRHRKARLVVVFLQENQMKAILSLFDNYGLEVGQFIWLSGDSLADSDLGELANGAFMLSLQVQSVPNYTRHYLNLTPSKLPSDPWIRFLWEMFYDCSWERNGTIRSCEDFSSIPYREQYMSDSSSIYMDGVLSFAHALHAMLEKDCPRTFIDPSSAMACINGPRLLKELRQVDFQGYSGRVNFDEVGDRLGKCTLKQYRYGNAERFKIVAEFDQIRDTFTVEDEAINWSYFQQTTAGENTGQTVESTNELDGGMMNGSIPEAVCSKPCTNRQIAIPQELPCCWECHDCRANERLVTNGSTTCQECPELTWPDEEAGDTCVPIAPVYLTWPSIPTLMLSVLGGMLLSLLFAFIVWFHQHRMLKLIKASSRELSIFIFIGVFLATVTNFLMILPPKSVICQVSTCGFHLSMTVIFVPQLLKMLRIYRIFKGSKEGKTNMPFTSNRCMILSTIGGILFQVVIIFVTSLLWPTQARLHMPVAIIPEVELFCDMSLEAMLPGLSFNLLILILCAILGFLTRKLPENFNESWYSYICVSTTVFMWLVFLPAYFTAFFALYRAILLASCMLISGTITLTCLFIPKVYAVHCVDEGVIQFFQSTGQVAPSSTLGGVPSSSLGGPQQSTACTTSGPASGSGFHGMNSGMSLKTGLRFHRNENYLTGVEADNKMSGALDRGLAPMESSLQTPKLIPRPSALIL